MEHLLFSSEDILERVDEYTLYCSYLGYEPLIGAKYISPIRTSIDSKPDTDPSFGIYERKYGKTTNELMWKDQGRGIHGDIFDLVRYLCKFETRRQAQRQILIDSGLVEGVRSRPVIDTCSKRYMGYANIDVQSRKFNNRELNYWDRINVTPDLLKWYDIRAINLYWLFNDQPAPRYPKGMGFSYHIWDKCQLYFPQEEKRKKFRTDWTEPCVPGFLQLQYNSPLLIITKSMKDVACLRSFGYEAIAPRGENIMLPKECISYVKKRYEKVLILFDNDGKTKAHEYEFDKIWIPKIWDNDKDLSDFCSNHGKQDTAELLRSLTTY